MEASGASGEPFLLMVNFLHVHTPLFCAPEFKNKENGNLQAFITSYYVVFLCIR